MHITAQTQAEFDEQIADFFRRTKTKADAEKELAKHSTAMLAELPNMISLLEDYPAYGAMAFYGKMQITDRKLITRLASSKTSAEEAIAAIRAAKALKIAASAKEGWDFLLQNNQPALWGAIQLNSQMKKPSLAPVRDANDDDDSDCEDNDNYDNDDNNDEDSDDYNQ